jgi:hypothetical protein
MLLTREEMAFDFHGAKLDPVKDKEIIVWSVQQFLYGEITGIQIGHWLYNAPDLESARFSPKSRRGPSASSPRASWAATGPSTSRSRWRSVKASSCRPFMR